MGSYVLYGYIVLQTQERVAFGKPLAAQGTIQADIAQSRIEIEQVRLLVLKAANMMDNFGNKVSIVLFRINYKYVYIKYNKHIQVC